ncbi:MAG: DEAD/DEAH box helicase, partial [Spirochaetia bacterium]
TVPSPVQQKTIPAALTGRDILVSAQTGSGKTAAFLLPIIESLLPKKRGTTRVLVLAPTRELALQITEHFNDLSAGTSLTCAAVYGGVGMNPQIAALKKGVDLVVATPGRLLDHMQYHYANFSSLEYLVFDEADRMFDMGFLPDMKRILGKLPKERQTMMFSATLPDPIIKLARRTLNAPIRISIDPDTRAAEGISHTIFSVNSHLKMDLLLQILRDEITGSAIVFTRTKYRADKVAKFLHKNGVPSERIHGNRSQAQRNKALSGFKQYDFRVLAATDIAARGIDVEELQAVINFDIPNVPEEYIHRVGRTARASAKGEAFSLVAPEEEKDLRAIERHMKTRLNRKTLESFDYKRRPPRDMKNDRRFEQGGLPRSRQRVRKK